MSHCQKCEKIFEFDKSAVMTGDHQDCPGCGHEAEIARLQGELKVANFRAVDFEERLRAVQDQRDALRTRLVALEGQVEWLRSQLEHIRQTIRRRNREDNDSDWDFSRVEYLARACDDALTTPPEQG